ncbi:MAG: hypothetical protein JWP00_1807 [Chloroflexi bacterium]|jgi:hypothetical protein|nr:hypothetical protein [Chloroflexota bacterium]
MTISAERRGRAFSEAQTFAEFIESMQVNQADFRANFASYSLTEAEKAFFAGLPGPLDVLVLAHDWCGDVLANLPLFGRIEADTGKLRLHIIPRDPHNTDIAAAYPYPLDGSTRIPAYVFFNQAGEELGVFIERPAVITALQKGWSADFFAANPGLEGKNKPLGDLPEEVKQPLLKYLKARRREAQAEEKAAILQEIQPILNRTLTLVN